MQGLSLFSFHSLVLYIAHPTVQILSVMSLLTEPSLHSTAEKEILLERAAALCGNCKEKQPDLQLGFPTAALLRDAAGSSQCSHEGVSHTWALVLG